jgi:hypothetical protein
LSKDEFIAFKRLFQLTRPGTDERTYIEALLTNILATHSEIRMIEAAASHAEEEEATLVYRTGPKSFGLNPPPILKDESSGGEGGSDEEGESGSGKKEKKGKRELKRKASTSSSSSSEGIPQTASSSSNAPSLSLGMPSIDMIEVPVFKKPQDGKEKSDRTPKPSTKKLRGFLTTSSKEKMPMRKIAANELLLLEIIRKVVKSFKEPEKEEGEPPENLRQLVEDLHGPVIDIDGDEIACYIRSLVTAASRIYNLIEEEQIEIIVSAIQDHLSFVRLRTRGQMINAGGLVGAEVRRVLQILTGQLFDPRIRVVEWSTDRLSLTDFQVNDGNMPVWLFYTPGHFDLIDKH